MKGRIIITGEIKQKMRKSDEQPDQFCQVNTSVYFEFINISSDHDITWDAVFSWPEKSHSNLSASVRLSHSQWNSTAFTSVALRSVSMWKADWSSNPVDLFLSGRSSVINAWRWRSLSSDFRSALQHGLRSIRWNQYFSHRPGIFTRWTATFWRMWALQFLSYPNTRRVPKFRGTWDRLNFLTTNILRSSLFISHWKAKGVQ